jgi:septal ring factor EnvC (AmiA/AmiB activator)
MNKLSAFFIAAAMMFSVSMLAGCENGEKTEVTTQSNTELEQTQKELDQIKQDSTKLDKYVTDLKNEINHLKIENQRLIAQTKRLEAEIIDLKLELGQVPESDSADVLDQDAEPAPPAESTPAPGSPAH